VDLIGCSEFLMAGCYRLRSEPMDCLDGGDLFVVLSFQRRNLLCGGSCYENVIEITRKHRIHLTYIFSVLKHFCFSSANWWNFGT
jgi:hypothetical protein